MENKIGVLEKEARSRIGVLIIKAREAKGLTQENLAELSGVTRVNIAKLETAKYNASVKILTKVLAPLGYRLTIEEI